MKLFRFQQQNGRSSSACRTVGLVAILLLGGLCYLAANPEAHERLHAAAGHEDHQCAVTAFAAGEGLYLAPVIEVRPRAALVEAVLPIAPLEALREAPAYLLLPICGPPVLA